MRGNDWSPPVGRWDAEVETLTRPSPLSLHVGSIRWSCCLLYWIRNFWHVLIVPAGRREKKNQLIYLNKSTENEERKQPRGGRSSASGCAPPTSHMQTAEETRDLLPVGVDAGDEGQRGPQESVALLGEAQEHYAGVSVQVFHCGGDTRQGSRGFTVGFPPTRLQLLWCSEKRFGSLQAGRGGR